MSAGNGKTDPQPPPEKHSSGRRGRGPGPPSQSRRPPPPPSIPPPPQSGTPAPRRWGGVLGINLLLLAGAAVAGYHYLEQRLQVLGQGAATHDRHVDQRLQGLVAHDSEQQQLLLQLQQQQAESAALQRSPGAELWSLAELESLVKMASYQLQLQADVPGALAALELAHARLQELDDASPVLAQLRTDMDRLRAVQLPDLPALSKQLLHLYRGIHHLPAQPAPAARTSAAPGPPPQGWLERLWRMVGFSAQRLEDSTDLLYAGLRQEQAAGLVRLELEGARHSLYARDAESFQASLSIVRTLLERHYDARHASVRNLLGMLEQLQGVQIDPEVPELRTSVASLRDHYATGGP